MSGAQKAAITDTFLPPHSVRVQLHTKAEDNFLILSTQKAKEVEKQNSVSQQILHRANLFGRTGPAFPRFSRDLAQLQRAQSLRFVPGYKH